MENNTIRNKRKSILFNSLNIIIIFFSLYLFIKGSAKDYWLIIVLIPIPILAIIFSIINGKNNIGKNVTTLSVISLILIIVAIFFFAFYKSHERKDYALVSRIENVISFELPDSGSIITNDFTDRDPEKRRYKTLSKVEFNIESQIQSLEERIANSNLWVNDMTKEMKAIIPYYLITEGNNYLLYNVEKETYNEESPAGAYNMILIYYFGDGEMSIVEYEIETGE